MKSMLALWLGLLVSWSPPAFAQPTELISDGLPGLDAAAGDVFYPTMSGDGQLVAFTANTRQYAPGVSSYGPHVYLHDRSTGRNVHLHRGGPGSLSSGGRYLAFSSADPLVPEDTNAWADVYVLDRELGTILLASASSTGDLGDAYSRWPSISTDGRLVAFVSQATNLVPGDRNGEEDVFVHDTWTRTTVRVSVSSDGMEADGHSQNAVISGDGRCVTFESTATNLVAGDTNASPDIFVHDLPNGRTERVSVSSAGIEANAYSQWPSISFDGRYVAFESGASNLVPSDSNSGPDIFVYDRQTSQISLESVDSSGNPPAYANNLKPSISHDGRYVAFESQAALVPEDTNEQADIYVRDRFLGKVVRASVDSSGNEGAVNSRCAAIAGDGRSVAFLSESNLANEPSFLEQWYLFIHDLESLETHKVRADPRFHGANDVSSFADVSSDGRYVAFESRASNLVLGDRNTELDVFLRDMRAGTTRRISVDRSGVEGDSPSRDPAISADARFVAYSSQADHLVPGDGNHFEDVFVFDQQTGSTTRTSLGPNGEEGNWWSWQAAISGDGRFVAFTTLSSNLVPGDLNDAEDVFVRDRWLQTTAVVSVTPGGITGNGDSQFAALSGNGRWVAFESFAPDLVPSDLNGLSDVFVHDRDPDGNGLYDEGNGITLRVSVSSAGAEADQGAHRPAISSDGRWVAFESSSTNLVPGDRNGKIDVFVHDRNPGTTRRVSVDSSGVEGDGDSTSADLSGNGRWVVFQSEATNLVPGDVNGQTDIFLHDLRTGITRQMSLDSRGDPAGPLSAQHSESPVISADGRFVVFESEAATFTPNDVNGLKDVFRRDRVELELIGIPRAAQPVHFEVSQAIGETGNAALVLLSCSGTSGFELPGDGRTVLLTLDACTVLSAGPWAPFLTGTIDALGTARTATVSLPSLPPGLTFQAAAVTIDAKRFVSITGPLEILTQ